MKFARFVGRRAFTLGALALVLAIVAHSGAKTLPGPPATAKADDAPDLILLNGRITVLDAANSTVEALAIRDGEIIATGTSPWVRRLKGDDTKLVNLSGRSVLPGLIDGTLHGIRMGSYFCFSRSPRFDPIFTRAEAIANVALKASQTPTGKWLFQAGGGWHVNQLDVPGMLTKAELDAAAPNHPVYIQGGGFSGGQVNTRALQVLGLGPGSPGVVLDASGQPTGQLTGAANTLAVRTVGTDLDTLTLDEQVACTEDFIREMNKRGLTGWDDPGGNNPFSPTGVPDPVIRGDHGYQAINRLHRDGKLNARVRFNFSCFGSIIGMPCVQESTVNAISTIGDNMLRVGGMGEEVMNTTGGIYADPEYASILEYLAANEWEFEHHATAAVTQEAMVASWERVNAIHPIADLNWTMLHPGDGPTNPTADTLARLKALNAGVVPTNTNVDSPASTDHPPYRRIYESGTRACLGTDALNVTPYPPFLNVWYTISGKTTTGGQGVVPDQRLTRLEALRIATEKCGWFISLDGQVGTLEVGKLADLIVLSNDYFTVPEDEIKNLTSVLTVVDGRIVYGDAEFASLDD
jgi:predicted amidohydrolase YtcJ